MVTDFRGVDGPQSSLFPVIMSLRTYALYDCNKPLLAILVFLSVVSGIVNLQAVYKLADLSGSIQTWHSSQANMVNQVFWVTYPNVHSTDGQILLID